MDERVLQLKQMKKLCKKMRARAGWGWKLFAWLFFVVFIVLSAVTLFVLFNHTPAVQVIDSRLWEPLKAAMKFGIDYAYFWHLAEDYSLIASACSGILWLLSAILGKCASAKVKKTDAYLSYRTLKLTLKTEKEEKQ